MSDYGEIPVFLDSSGRRSNTEPTFTSPRYVAFEVALGVLLALWTGRSGHTAPSTPPRPCEVGLMVP